MKGKIFRLFLAVALLIGFIAVFLPKEKIHPAVTPSPTANPKPTKASSDQIATTPLAVSELQSTSSHPLAILFGKNPTLAKSEVKTLAEILQFYRMEFGSYPAGQENRDIMNALTGRNPQKLAIFPRQHPRLDANGQLLDAWGHPFHFHPISSQHLEIRSLGPDGEIFTTDDIVTPPTR
jgi:Type II secretion system (T2SS), protein G